MYGTVPYHTLPYRRTSLIRVFLHGTVRRYRTMPYGTVPYYTLRPYRTYGLRKVYINSILSIGTVRRYGTVRRFLFVGKVPVRYGIGTLNPKPYLHLDALELCLISHLL
jgi:hypothetical protein